MKKFKIISLFILAMGIGLSAFAQSSTTEKKKSPVFAAVEQQAKFPGGEKALMLYLANNVKYPQIASENGITGIVYIGFKVNKDGSIADAKIIRDIGGNCGQAAFDAVNNMPKWTPARNNGEAVRSFFTLPVRFELKDEPTRKGSSVRTNPEFPGGERALGKFIYTHMHYPDKAQMLGITGTVRITFTVTRKGKILNARIAQDIGGGCGTEALRLVSLMPKWKRGTLKGKPTSTTVTLPITFDMRTRKYKKRKRSKGK